MRLLVWLCLSLVLAAWAAANDTQTIPRVAPAPPDNPITEAKVRLGKMLFFDKRLSVNQTVSCESCHPVTSAAGNPPPGTDRLRVSRGVFGLVGSRNSPTVWNAGLRKKLFWDGRADSLEAQAKGPPTNPVEMGMPHPEAITSSIAKVRGYAPLFREAFGGPDSGGQLITYDRVAQAIATYERTLMTPNSPFDRFQKGDAQALSAQAQRGWKRFQDLACVACHGAPTFTGSDYFVPFPLRSSREIESQLKIMADPGRMQATQQLGDRNRWRVPSLRNVAITGPYFHNGSVNTLEEAVRLMGQTQLGRKLSDSDVSEIVAFLESLTGQVPIQTPPELPR